MKIVKKSLIITSALALGLLVAGCGKKSVVINKNNTYTMSNLTRYEKVNDFANKLNIRVKKHSLLNNSRMVWYVTTNDESVIYDIMSDKVIYKTFDKILSISQYLDSDVFMISFDDGDNSRMLIASNGTVLAEKDNYANISALSISLKENEKKNNFTEKTFYVLTKKNGESSKVKFYKLIKAGVKDYKGKLIEDISLNYTLTEITEEEARKYKKGDLYPKSEYSFDYDDSGSELQFYDETSNRVVLTMNYGTSDKKVLILKDKALVQLYKETTSKDNYDVTYRDEYYNIETYIVDLKNASYKKVDKFNYFIGESGISEVYDENDNEYPKYYILTNAGLIEDRVVSNRLDIAIDNNIKVVQKDQKLVYEGTYFYDLGNGNYVTEESGITYLTDKNGSIKKVFDGYSRVLYESKLIMIYDSYSYSEIKFIDFKGNYISDKNINTRGVTIVSDKEVYYKDAADPTKRHLLKLDNKAIVSDEIVDYEIYASTTISSVTSISSEKDRYYSTYNFYCTAKPVDNNSDDVYDTFDVTYYTIDGNQLGQTSKVSSLVVRNIHDYDYRYLYEAVTIVDETATDYTLQIDLLAKK